MSHVTLLGDSSWRLATGFLWIWGHTPFSFCCYCFVSLSLSHEHNYILSPISPYRELSNLAVVLKLILNTDTKMFIVILALGVCVCV